MQGKKQQGKIISVPIRPEDIKEGIQVLYDNKHIARIVKIWNNWVDINSDDFIGARIIYKSQLPELKQLVVGYDRKMTCPSCGGHGTKYGKRCPLLCDAFGYVERIVNYPLKYSQWEAAIANGEVDSDKVVEFDQICANHHSPESKGKPKDFVYARIIPAKKKLYTEEEVENIIVKFAEAAGMHEELLWHFANDYESAKSWWTENK